MIRTAEKFIEKTKPDQLGFFLRRFKRVGVDVTEQEIELLNNEFANDYENAYNQGISYSFDEKIFSIAVNSLLEFIDTGLFYDGDPSDDPFSDQWKALYNKIKDLEDYTIYL